MKYLVLTFLLMGLSFPAMASDLTIIYQLKEGKKNKGEKRMYWSDQYQLTTGTSSKMDTLTDYKQGMIFIIKHDKKQIETLNMKELVGMMGGAKQMMGEMMNRPGVGGNKSMGESIEKSTNRYFGDPNKAVLQKLGTLNIAGRNCDNYKVERKGQRLEMSEEVCIDPSLIPPMNSNSDAQQMAEGAQEMLAGSLGNIQSSGQKELAGIKGTPLKRVNNSKAKGIFGRSTKELDEEATLVKEGPIDPAVFRLPWGYKQIDQGAVMREQMENVQKMMDGGER